MDHLFKDSRRIFFKLPIFNISLHVSFSKSNVKRLTKWKVLRIVGIYIVKELLIEKTFVKTFTPNKFRIAEVNTQLFFGQYILTMEKRNNPAGWKIHEFGQWCLFTLRLPVLNVYSQAKHWLGWCIGYPIVDGRVHPEHVILHTSKTNLDMASVDDFYQRTSGRWTLLLMEPGFEKIFLDPYGSLSTVFSVTEKIVASTPSLLGPSYEWNEELISVVELPQNDTWLPSGLTTRKNVRRLLPNHCLNLADWNVSRHWPNDQTDLSTDFDTPTAVAKIVDHIQEAIGAIARMYPLCFTLTAGRDSRMLLACARNYLNISTFFTFDVKKVDKHIAALLANQFKLNYRLLHLENASPEELEHWLSLTGLSVAGSIWKIHKTLERLDSERVLLPGTAGEVGRSSHWRSSDHTRTKITAKEFLTRYRLPPHPMLIKATEEWLAELQFLNTFALLDLAYIEQRLGCWAAPISYGNTTSVFELSPFNSRKIFHTMMRLPSTYRRNKDQLAIDICKYAWPELLNFPFNQFTGLKGYFYSNAKRIKKFLKEIIRYYF